MNQDTPITHIIHTLHNTITTIATTTDLPPFLSTFPGGPGLAGTRMSPFWILLIGAKNDGGGGGNWSYKTCKAPVTSPPPTNQHPAFYRSDSFLSPDQRVTEQKGKLMLLMLILLLPLRILSWSEKPYLYPTDLTSKRSGDLNQKNPTDSLQTLVPSIYICDTDTQRSNVAAASSTAIIINTLSLSVLKAIFQMDLD